MLNLLLKKTTNTSISFQLDFRDIVTRHYILIKSLYYCIRTELKGSYFELNKSYRGRGEIPEKHSRQSPLRKKVNGF